MKLFLIFCFIGLAFSCSRTLEKDYKVVDASKDTVPEWVSGLHEWLDDEESEEERQANRYYTYSTEPKISQSISCEIAKAKSSSSIAAEVSTFIKESFAQSVNGDPTKIGTKLSEYIQNDLQKDVQANLVGAQVYRVYWEKRRYMKDEGAKQDWDGYVCTSLIKISKTHLEKAFKRTEALLLKKSENTTKKRVQEIMKKASKGYTLAK